MTSRVSGTRSEELSTAVRKLVSSPRDTSAKTVIDLNQIWKSPRLPSLPAVAVRLLELSRDPDASIRDIVKTVKSDPAIAARILKTTNSTYFGFSCKIASIERAVPLLGVTTVVGLTLSFSLSQDASQPGKLGEYFQSFWKQSVIQAATAEVLGNKHTGSTDCDYFLAGLLIDLGRLAMLRAIPDEYVPVIQSAATDRRSLSELEIESIGIDHAEVGYKLLADWNLPESLQTAIRHHHAELDCLKSLDDQTTFDVAKAAAVAAAVGDLFCSPNDGMAFLRLQELTRDLYGFSEEALMEFLDEVKPRIEAASAILDVETGEIPAPLDLMAEANARLADLAVRESVAHNQAAEQSQAAEHEVVQLEQSHEQLENQVRRDEVTGVFSRGYFDESLQQMVDHCCRTAASVGVLIADIDHFKQINDQHGHRFGDRVLERVAWLLERMLRDTDITARYGGEEFVVLVHQPTEEGLERVAERLRARIEIEEFEFDGVTVPVTISIGGALAIPRRNDHSLCERLVAAADEAMYESKRMGRNQCHLRVLSNEADRRIAGQAANRRFSRWLIERDIIDIPTISKALVRCRTSHIRIGELAERWHVLERSQVERVCAAQEDGYDRFGETAIELGLLSEEAVASLLALQQEDPTALAKAIVQLGILDPKTVAGHLKQYVDELVGEMKKTCPAQNSGKESDTEVVNSATLT